MYFLTDNNKKVIFGWSAKCGCSHIKNLFYYLTNQNTKDLHREYTGFSNDSNIDDYTIILVIRNPYERIVSGFLNKYNITGSFRKMWKNDEMLTFKNFVDNLVDERFDQIEIHHFTPQLSEKWHDDIKNHKLLKIFNIENIDYGYIETLYGKKIPSEYLQFRGQQNEKMKCDYKKISCNAVYLMQIDEICSNDDTPLFQNYYNNDIRFKVMPSTLNMLANITLFLKIIIFFKRMRIIMHIAYIIIH